VADQDRVFFLRFDTPDGTWPRDVARGWESGPAPGALLDGYTVRDLELITGSGFNIDGDGPHWISVADISGSAVALEAPTIGSVTVEVIVRIDLDAWLATSGPPYPVLRSPLVAWGAAATGVPWAVCLELVDADDGLVRPLLRWRNEADDAWLEAYGPVFVVGSASHVIIASRERAVDGFTVRWLVDGVAGQDATIHPLDVVTPGAFAAVAVAFNDSDVTAPGIVEAVGLQRRAVSLEELELAARRLTVHAPRARSALQRYLPPGNYSTDPDSLIQREVRAEAGLLAMLRGEHDLLTHALAPALAFGELLERWEAICQLPVRPADSIDARRAALVAHLRLQGFSLDEIRVSLAPYFGLDADDVEILQPDTTEFRDDFAAAVLDGDGYHDTGHDAARWTRSGGGLSWTFNHDTVSERYEITRGAGATDLRYLGRVEHYGDAGPPFFLHATGEGGLDTFITIGLSVATEPADNILIGMVVGDMEADDWTWIGVVKLAGVNKLGWIRYTGEDPAAAITARHKLAAAFTEITGITNLAASYIRVRDMGDGTMQVQHNATDPADWNAVATFEITGATPRVRWAGLGIVGTGSSVAGAIAGEWTYYAERAPRGAGRLTWFGFRDPGVAGSYDLVGADLVVQRVKPAHVDGSAISHQRGLHLDDATTLLDRDMLDT
jgi:hypothetical protein